MTALMSDTAVHSVTATDCMHTASNRCARDEPQLPSVLVCEESDTMTVRMGLCSPHFVSKRTESVLGQMERNACTILFMLKTAGA